MSPEGDKMPEIISEVKKCPNCGHDDTVCRKAMREFQPNSTEFASLDKQATPLQQPALVVTSVPAILCHYDVCAECGTRYCTRAERISVPVVVKPGSPPPGFGRH